MDIRAILFDFDHPKNITVKEEILLDFPHDYKWTEKFRSSVFDVVLKDPSVLQEIKEEYDVRMKAD
jgi:hypothetical protein